MILSPCEAERCPRSSSLMRSYPPPSSATEGPSRSSDKVDDFGVARDDDGLLAILVFDLQRVSLESDDWNHRRILGGASWWFYFLTLWKLPPTALAFIPVQSFCRCWRCPPKWSKRSIGNQHCGAGPGICRVDYCNGRRAPNKAHALQLAPGGGHIRTYCREPFNARLGLIRQTTV
jgi:hypothetical protein